MSISKRIIIFSLLIFLLSSCMDSVGIPEGREDYVGTWQGEGIMLQIGSDGYVNYKKNKGGTEVSLNAPITKFDAEDFSAGVLGVTTEFNVEKTPFINDDGETQMIVDGNTLTNISSTTKSSNLEQKLTIPELPDLETLAKNTMVAFNSSAVKGDFTELYNSISEMWKGQTSAEDLADMFQVFIDNKDIILGTSTEKIVFSQDAQIDEEGTMLLKGYLPGENQANFELEYIYEVPNWKIIGISLNY